MAQSKSLLHRKNSFPVHKTPPRKAASRSPLQFDAEELKREFGSQYQSIDIRIGNLRMKLDLTQGIWVSHSSVTTANDAKKHFEDEAKLKKQKSELEEENALLSVKVDMLLEMLAQTMAEEELRDGTE